MNNFSEKVSPKDFKKIQDYFKNLDARVKAPIQYTVFCANVSGVNILLYSSGKLVFQGSDVSKLVNDFHKFMGIETQPEQKPLIENVPVCSFTDKPHIGTDESGKGDFFGPLCIAGVLADETNMEKFVQAGIKDSKKLDDERILTLANLIKANSVHSVLVFGNEKYNDLYTKFGNLNKLLAWGHARVIENILEKKPCNYALCDKFGNDALILNSLFEKGKKIKIEQRHQAEEDIAVAAASILARAEYVKRMDSMSRKYEFDFPKGANTRILITAKEFKNVYGKDRLKEVAKTHFKTYNQV